MRHVLAVLALIFLSLCVHRPAFAQQCMRVEADKFILHGVTSIESGETKGVAVVGDKALALAKAAGIPHRIVAFFFLDDIDAPDAMVIAVAETPDGELACVGTPNDGLRAAHRKFIGQGA